MTALLPDMTGFGSGTVGASMLPSAGSWGIAAGAMASGIGGIVSGIGGLAAFCTGALAQPASSSAKTKNKPYRFLN
jgi:hypothetical protein